jgi:methylthioribose-1-phosphate isomerase
MSKSRYNQRFDLSQLSNSIVLLHGVFEATFFDLIQKKKYEHVFVLEGRPSLAAAKTSSRQMLKRGIRPTLISDNMAGFLFYQGLVKEVWLAYHEADERGAMCFIGASILGVLARKHNIPVFCYPSDQAIDYLGLKKELSSFNDKPVAPKGTEVYLPLIEWVPGTCIGDANE